jgi:hypothetical protein
LKTYFKFITSLPPRESMVAAQGPNIPLAGHRRQFCLDTIQTQPVQLQPQIQLQLEQYSQVLDCRGIAQE